MFQEDLENLKVEPQGKPLTLWLCSVCCSLVLLFTLITLLCFRPPLSRRDLRVSTDPETYPTSTTVLLKGSVKSSVDQSGYFEYGPFYDKNQHETPLSPLSGGSLDQFLDTLEEQTNYSFRFIVRKEDTDYPGTWQSFSTLSSPLVEIEKPQVRAKSIVARGRIHPQGSKTLVSWFEYGASLSPYVHQTPQQEVIGTEERWTEISLNISFLTEAFSVLRLGTREKQGIKCYYSSGVSFSTKSESDSQ